MFKLVIGDTAFDKFLEFNLNLRYDSVASDFSFTVWFDPGNEAHKQAFKPGTYKAVKVYYNNDILLTGTVLNMSFTSTAQGNGLAISGYSITGVLEDCQIPTSAYPLHSKGLDLKSITEKICNAFNINVIVDPSVSDRISKVFKNAVATNQQSAKQYITDMAAQQGIIVTHDAAGNIVLTECNTKATPLFDFAGGIPGIEFGLDFDGQKMHSDVTTLRQAKIGGTNTKKNPVVGQETVSNPYCNVFRPRVAKQTAGDENDTGKAARTNLSEELKGIGLKGSLNKWEINGVFIKPNQIMTVENQYLFLFKKTRFFIESVSYKLDANGESCSINCYLPEVYNQDTPLNIFE